MMTVISKGSRTLPIVYALPFLAHSIVYSPLITVIPSFYSGDLGLPLALVGLAMVLARVSDVFTDPVVGALSDGTRSRFGRRKPWIVAGLPLLMLSTWMVFVPPGEIGFAYALIWLALVYLGFTMVDLPYKAWGAELSSDYHERTRISAWREGFGMVSGIVTLLLLFALPKLGSEGTAESLRVLAIIAVVAMPLLFAITLARVPEPEPERFAAPSLGLWARWKIVFTNRPFVIICAAMLFLIAGAVIGASLHLIVITQVFKAPDMFALIILWESIATIVAVPLWTRLAGKVGKHRALAIAVLWLALWSAPIPFLGPDTLAVFFAVIVIRGLSLGSLYVLLPAMIADTVDLDKSRTGEERTGLFFAVSGMVQKFGVALGVLLGTAIPPMFGFDNSVKSNSQEALRALTIVYAWLPMLIMACAAPFFWRYSLTREKQVALRAEIEDRLRSTGDGLSPTVQG